MMNVVPSITWLNDTIVPAAAMRLTVEKSILATHVVPEFAAVPLACSV